MSVRVSRHHIGFHAHRHFRSGGYFEEGVFSHNLAGRLMIGRLTIRAGLPAGVYLVTIKRIECHPSGPQTKRNSPEYLSLMHSGLILTDLQALLYWYQIVTT